MFDIDIMVLSLSFLNHIDTAALVHKM